MSHDTDRPATACCHDSDRPLYIQVQKKTWIHGYSPYMRNGNFNESAKSSDSNENNLHYHVVENVYIILILLIVIIIHVQMMSRIFFYSKMDCCSENQLVQRGIKMVSKTKLQAPMACLALFGGID